MRVVSYHVYCDRLEISVDFTQPRMQLSANTCIMICSRMWSIECYWCVNVWISNSVSVFVSLH